MNSESEHASTVQGRERSTRSLRIAIGAGAVVVISAAAIVRVRQMSPELTLRPVAEAASPAPLGSAGSPPAPSPLDTVIIGAVTALELPRAAGPMDALSMAEFVSSVAAGEWDRLASAYERGGLIPDRALADEVRRRELAKPSKFRAADLERLDASDLVALRARNGRPLALVGLDAIGVRVIDPSDPTSREAARRLYADRYDRLLRGGALHQASALTAFLPPGFDLDSHLARSALVLIDVPGQREDGGAAILTFVFAEIEPWGWALWRVDSVSVLSQDSPRALIPYF